MVRSHAVGLGTVWPREFARLEASPVLTKNSYLEFLRCPREFWLHFHFPVEIDDDLTLQAKHLRQQGFEILQLAKKMRLFTTEADGLVEFGRIFSTEHITTSTDITVTDSATGEISIYEVKSGTRVKPEYIDDVAFQQMTVEMLGFTVRETFLVTVDTSYKRIGDIDPNRLLKIEDITEQTTNKQPETIAETRKAIEYLNTQPAAELGIHCSAKLDCDFIRHHFKEIPSYNVTHISRLSSAKCTELLGQAIIDIRDMPADFELTDRQRRQVEVARSPEPLIDRDAIRAELASLNYPLHFLDFESFSYPIPHFSGTRPYQQVVFQYSLHSILEPGAEPMHTYHLARNDGASPPREVAESLRDVMSGQLGTTVVWNASFEKARNSELGAMFPDLADFFDQLNESLYDLREIFSGELYQDAAFCGGTSLKDVQPVLYPDASYDLLAIGDGTTASIRWYQMISGKADSDESEQIYRSLCEYCRLDTYAMVKIFEVLKAV